MSQTLVADQPVFQNPDFLVCTGGTYADDDRVAVYSATDESKTPILAYSAIYIATGLHPAQLPPASVEAFETAIWGDPNFPEGVKLGLALFFPLVREQIANPAGLQMGWQIINHVNAPSQQNPSGWLSDSVRQTVEHYAQINGVQIVAS